MLMQEVSPSHKSRSHSSIFNNNRHLSEQSHSAQSLIIRMLHRYWTTLRPATSVVPQLQIVYKLKRTKWKRASVPQHSRAPVSESKIPPGINFSKFQSKLAYSLSITLGPIRLLRFTSPSEGTYFFKPMISLDS